jgi:hypothetical protein
MGVGVGFDRDELYDSRTLLESKPIVILKGKEALDGFARGISRLLEGGHVLHYKTSVQDIPVSVENRVGSIRRGGHGRDAWETKMRNAYGRIPRTKGADGDALDVYLGPNEDAAYAYVVHQLCPETGEFDEDKIMLGFDSKEDAKKAFFKHYDEPEKYFGGIDQVSMWALKKKIESGRGLKKITESSFGSRLKAFEAGVKGMKWGIVKHSAISGRTVHAKDLTKEEAQARIADLRSGHQRSQAYLDQSEKWRSKGQYELIPHDDGESNQNIVARATKQAEDKRQACIQKGLDKIMSKPMPSGIKTEEHGIKGQKWGIRHDRRDTGHPRRKTNVFHLPHKKKLKLLGKPKQKIRPKSLAHKSKKSVGYHIPSHEQFLKNYQNFMDTHKDFLDKHPELARIARQQVVDPMQDYSENAPKNLQTLLNKTASKQDQTAHTTAGLHKEAFKALADKGWQVSDKGSEEIHVKGGAGFATKVISPNGVEHTFVTVRGPMGFAHYVGKDAMSPLAHPSLVAIKKKAPTGTSSIGTLPGEEQPEAPAVSAPEAPPQTAAPEAPPAEAPPPVAAPEPASKPRMSTRYSKSVPVYGKPGQAVPPPTGAVPGPASPFVGRHKRMPHFAKAKPQHAKRRIRRSDRESQMFESRVGSFLREARKSTLYYARPMDMYGTDEEAEDIETILSQFPGHRIKASGPKSLRTHGVSKIIKSCRGRDKDMTYFHKHVDKSDGVVVRPVKGKRYLSAGTWSEARHALKKKIPVYLVHEGKIHKVRAVRLERHPDNQGVFGRVVL